MVNMNRLSTAKRAAVVAALVEGCSIRATVRMTGVAKNTIVKLLVELGAAVLEVSGRDASQPAVQARSSATKFGRSSARRTRTCPQTSKGSSASAPCGRGRHRCRHEADSVVARRRRATLARRTSSCRTWPAGCADRVQLTTDGHKPYLAAVEGAFGVDIDYAMLMKIYGADPHGEKRYSPAVCLGCETKVVTGDPNPKHISTSATWSARTSRCGCRCAGSRA